MGMAEIMYPSPSPKQKGNADYLCRGDTSDRISHLDVYARVPVYRTPIRDLLSLVSLTSGFTPFFGGITRL